MIHRVLFLTTLAAFFSSTATASSELQANNDNRGNDTASTTYAASQKCSNVQDNTDYYGNDMATTRHGVAEDCCADCTNTPGCVVSVWFKGTCYLKNKVGKASQVSGARAVFPKSLSPPPPAPSPSANPGPITQSTLHFINRCNYPIKLHKVDKLVCTINPGGGTCDQNLAVGEHPMFRHTQSAEVTLVEFSKTSDRLWFDVSVVPPNCGNGHSHAECLRNNGGRRGFNVPVSLVPQKYNDNPSKGNCHSVKCPHDVCPEAYTYPFDDFKMKDCPVDESVVVTYCP
ncbi:Aste57867_7219 [Aphanomyces stellatus]|uniref:Aste57867_7219 protein n=3 Tax=Aphanomyces stellatus TaxID=120398 RepID=A0A485KFP0_9STRA|nr:hypothetical protein As57867_007194 [Aphanomyces stellatus]VFT84145.1 Aste57867_7219 [Aphanomyces stellatus]